MTVRRLARAAVGVAVLSLVVALPGTAAADPTLGTAQQRAAALRTQVDRLTLAASQATEAYDTAESQLGALVTRTLLAQQQLDGLSALTRSDRSIQRNRVRALYMSGGSAGLLSSVLDAHNIEDAALRLHTVQSIVAGDRDRTAHSQSATEAATRIQHTLDGLTARQTALQLQADKAATGVRAALAEQQQLLARADQQVRTLAAKQRAADQAKAAADFQRQLADARALATLGNAAALGAAPGVWARAGSATSFGTGSGTGAGSAPDGESPPTRQAAAAIVAARTVLGDPYVWGATGPDAFDCSGLTGWAYRQAGVDLPRTSREQWTVGRHVDLAELAPGDLLFWAADTGDPGSIHHVTLYLGGGLMIAAPDTGDVVKVQAVYLNGYIGAVRPIG